MDVTLLLNQSTAPAGPADASRESTPSYAAGPSTAPSTALPTPSPDRSFPQRHGEPRQGRGRTPWSAGGYSLPLHGDAKYGPYPVRSSSEHPDADAPYHHWRTSSVDSDTASPAPRPQPCRIATCDSTGRPFESLGMRTPDSEPLMAPRHKFSDSHSSLSSYGSWHSRSHSRMSSVTTISGSQGLSLPILECERDNDDHARGRTPGDAERPGSPSNAVPHMNGLARHPDGPLPSFSRAPHLLSSPKLHKRAISAPDFASIVGSRLPRPPYAVLPPPRQGMAMSSTSPPPAARHTSRLSVPRITPGRMHSSPDLASQAPAEDGAAALAPRAELAEPRCMFVANCDTGSQLRKAISHLFGRNKSCTLKIPKEVWVYYCRKHYQRIRYRNARTYPSNQMELVKVQIRRLQAWSEANRARGDAPYIKQWTLSLRKREQNRLETGRAAAEDAAGDEDPAAAPPPPGGSVVPDWIIQLVGDGYTTEKMLEIAERLHKDIGDGVLGQVPEIEFLPDIVDDDEAKAPRARRQNSSAGGSKMPKRKADFGAMSRQSSLGGDGPLPELGADDDDAVSALASPFGKRARIGSFIDHSAAYPDGGRAGPPRAPKVVPKMRPLEHGFGPGRGPQRGPGHGHVRGFHSFGGQPNPGPGPGPGAMYPEGRRTLPSISAHMAHAPVGHAPSRTAHQRSASAFTLASRPMHPSARPSSSGNGAGALYELGSHPSHDFQPAHHAPGPLYHDEPSWAAGYSPAYAPHRTAFHQPAMYGVPVHLQEMSPRSASSSYGMPETSVTYHDGGSGA